MAEPTKPTLHKAVLLLVEFCNRYVRHDEDCQWVINHTECTCGFDEHLRLVAEMARARFTPEEWDALEKLRKRLGLAGGA